MDDSAERITRGAAFKRGVAAAATGLVVASATAVRAEASRDQDEAIAVVKRLIRLEEATAAAYELAADRGALRGLARAGPRYVREQELRHREVLIEALQKLEGTLARELPPPLALDIPVRAPEAAIARAVLRLEQRTYAGYLEAHSVLRGGGLLAILTAIMANEGQHLAMLRLAVNRKPVPTAFETAGPNTSSILGGTR